MNIVKLYILTFMFFISCHPVRTYERSITMLPDSNVPATYLINTGSIEVSHIFENDTSTISLEKYGVNLLAVRIYSTNKGELSIQRGKIITDKIEIPTQETIQGFALNWIKEIEKGFEISIEYGGSGRYYHKDSRFYFEGKDFILKDIIIDTFDKRNPEDEKSFTKMTNTLDSTIRFKDFKIVDYL